MNVDLVRPDATSGLTLHVGLAGASTAVPPARQPHLVPFEIQRSQYYYWTQAWREGEAAALADLEAGRSRVFDDPRELARYLLRPGD